MSVVKLLILSKLRRQMLSLFLITSPKGAVAKYCDEHVCLSVCLSVREHISGTTRAIYTNFSVHVAYGRGLVLLWQGDKIPRDRAILGVVRAIQKHRQSLLQLSLPSSRQKVSFNRQ